MTPLFDSPWDAGRARDEHATSRVHYGPLVRSAVWAVVVVVVMTVVVICA